MGKMKQLKYILMAFAAVPLAVSCSKGELPGEGGDTPVTGQTYTFTVSPDVVMEGEAETRTPTATTDDQPTRCFMQVYDAAAATKVTNPIAGTPSNDNGDYTFTTKLFSNTEYTYLFWADNANVEVADLKAVPYTAGTVAFSYRTKGTPENVAKTTVSLKHAVTKLTLQTTTETSVDAGEDVRVTASCASSYNVAAPPVLRSLHRPRKRSLRRLPISRAKIRKWHLSISFPETKSKMWMWNFIC